MSKNVYRSPEKLKAEADYWARQRSNAMIDRLHVKPERFACCICADENCSHVVYGKIRAPLNERLVFCYAHDPGLEEALAMLATVG